jgi:hypothetical protein
MPTIGIADALSWMMRRILEGLSAYGAAVCCDYMGPLLDDPRESERASENHSWVKNEPQPMLRSADQHSSAQPTMAASADLEELVRLRLLPSEIGEKALSRDHRSRQYSA